MGKRRQPSDLIESMSTVEEYRREIFVGFVLVGVLLLYYSDQRTYHSIKQSAPVERGENALSIDITIS